MTKYQKLLYKFFLLFTFGSVIFTTNFEFKENLSSKNILEKTNITFGLKRANAENITYKISSINNSDVTNYCIQRGKNDRQNWDNGYKQYKSDWGYCTKERGYKSKLIKLDVICEYKHQGYGTWLGDGGNSCYDSYWKWW